MSTEYHQVTTAITVLPVGDTIGGDTDTTVRIDDDGAGAFLVLEQHWRADANQVRITLEEWPAIRSAVERMFDELLALELRTPGGPAKPAVP